MTGVTAALRRQVFELARNCCEYCRIPYQPSDPFTFHVDHIRAVKHGGSSEIDNLGLSCPECNGYKGSDIASIDPVTGELALFFHPRKQKWSDHFTLNGASIVPKTPEGRVTVKLLRLNEAFRIEERVLLLRLGLFPCGDAES